MDIDAVYLLGPCPTNGPGERLRSNDRSREPSFLRIERLGIGEYLLGEPIGKNDRGGRHRPRKRPSPRFINAADHLGQMGLLARSSTLDPPAFRHAKRCQVQPSAARRDALGLTPTSFACKM
jgi:hypothetical protein